MRALLCPAAVVCAAASALAQSGPAALTPYGAGCPAPDSVYELFTATAAGDLAGTSLMLTSNGDGWAVGHGGQFDPNFSNNLALGDDQLSTNHALGFAFPVPGAGTSTTAIDIDSNGWIGLISGQHTSTDVTETVAELLAGPPRLALWWDDLDPSAAGGVYFDVFPTHAMVTFDSVPQFGNADANTFQVQFYPNGDLVLCWTSDCDEDGLVGYSPGNGALDPGPTDLSAAVPFPYTTFAPFAMGGTGLPLLGSTFSIDLSNIPARSTAGVVNWGITGATPIDLAPAGMPHCSDYLNAFLIDVLSRFPVAAPTASLPINVPNDTTLVGATAELQAVVIAPGINPLGVVTSNAVQLRLGTRNPVSVLASGANSYNAETTSGFFRIVNGSGLAITNVQLDWSSSSNPAQLDMRFDVDQTGMMDRFDGGNSALSGCRGTYRGGCDATTGLVYSGTPVAPCDPGAATGWTPSNPTSVPSEWRTLDFAFTGFAGGLTFEFDADTDGGIGLAGGDMEGLVVTITFAGGSVVSGELVRRSATEARVDL